jgi:S1-C subfamily serine protease
VRRGFFGMELEDTAQGLRIRALLPGSPAAQANLAAGDLILKLVPPQSDPAATHSYADVLRLTANVAPGENTVFVVQRGAQRLKYTVRAGKEGL